MYHCEAVWFSVLQTEQLPHKVTKWQLSIHFEEKKKKTLWAAEGGHKLWKSTAAKKERLFLVWKLSQFFTHDRIFGPSRATCHTAVAQLDTSYPAVRPVYCSIPAAQANQTVRPLGEVYLCETLQRVAWNKQSLPFRPFSDVRNCALGSRNPKRDSDWALNPHRSISSQPGSLLKEIRKMDSFK